jgi:hypothetical protein
MAKLELKGNAVLSQRKAFRGAIDYLNFNYRYFPFDPEVYGFMMATPQHPFFEYKGCTMKNPLFAILAVAAFLPVTSLAQHSSKAAESKHSDLTAGKSPTKAVTITGQISADGKTLVSEADDIWAVSNPGVMHGLEGQKVLVKCQTNTSKSEIHVFWVKAVLQNTKYTANRGDSAFRR